MGAFLSGLLGAAGQDIEKQSDRAYQEKRQERMDRMKILELAASNPNTRPEALPNIFGELDDLAKDAGYKSQNKGIKNPFSQMGKMVGHILTRRQQQQQQQGQQDQARRDVQGAPGVTAQPATDGIAPPIASPDPNARIASIPQPSSTARIQPIPNASSTPPMPRSRFGGDFYAQADYEAMGEKEFQTGLKHSGQTSQAEFDQKLKEVDQLVKQGYPKQEAQQIVFGRSAVVGQKFAPFYVSGAQVPQETQVDALGNPIDREKGMYKLEETTGKFYPASGAPKAAGSDDLAKWTKVAMAANPRLTQEQAQQQVAKALERTKFLLPQQRLQAMYDTLRYIPGEQGALGLPTRVRGAGGAATPPLPQSRVAPGAGATGQLQAGQPRVIPYPAGFQPEVKGAERGRKDNAEVIMSRGGAAINTIQQITQAHPEWTGLGGSLWQDVQKKFGTADPRIGQLQGAMESLVGFLPSLHGFRSKSILDSWKTTLDNPLKNPALTQSAIREIMKAAEELRNVILKRDTGEMTAESAERKAGGGSSGARPVNPY